MSVQDYIVAIKFGVVFGFGVFIVVIVLLSIEHAKKYEKLSGINRRIISPSVFALPIIMLELILRFLLKRDEGVIYSNPKNFKLKDELNFVHKSLKDNTKLILLITISSFVIVTSIVLFCMSGELAS